MSKKLYKSKSEKMICGVCGGIAEYFDIDPTLVRLGCAVITFGTGVGLLGYIAAAIIIPSRPEDEDTDIIDME